MATPVPMRPPAGRAGLAEVRLQLLAESEAMLRHAFGSGLQVPPGVVEIAAQVEGCGVPGATGPALRDQPLEALAQLHAQLARLVAPATPRTIHLLDADPERGSLWSVLGPLPNVRRLTAGAALSTGAFVLISLAPQIDHTAMKSDIYTLDSLPLLVTLCFLLASAAIGSTFHALFTAQGFVAEGTYDPRYDASYWIRIGLGIVAGLLLSVLVPISPTAETSSLTKPLLALLGGFSAGLVYRVLMRLVDTVESLFKGDQKELQRRQEEVHRANAQRATAQTRVDLAEQLIGLRDEVAKGASPERLNEKLSAVLNDLLKRNAGAGTVTSPAPPRPDAH